eukprot:scaffold2423_cov242-Prasinococcus_capsulatus_cf.AAC.2
MYVRSPSSASLSARPPPPVHTHRPPVLPGGRRRQYNDSDNAPQYNAPEGVRGRSAPSALLRPAC